MSRSIKPSSTMRSLNKPPSASVPREGSSERLFATSNRAVPKSSGDPAKQQLSAETAFISCYNNTRNVQASLQINKSDKFRIVDSDGKITEFKWETVGLKRKGRVLVLRDNARSLLFKLQLTTKDFVLFQSFAFDKGKVIVGVADEPLSGMASRHAKSRKPLGGVAIRVLASGKLGTQAKSIDRTPLESPLSKNTKSQESLEYSVTYAPETHALRTNPLRRPIVPFEFSEKAKKAANVQSTDAHNNTAKLGMDEELKPASKLLNASKFDPQYKEGASITAALPAGSPDIEQNTDRLQKRKNENHDAFEDFDGLCIDPDMENVARLNEAGFKPFVYTFRNGRSIRITANELCRLEEKVFLDDTLIQFYFQRAMDTLAETDFAYAQRTYLFNPFFYTRVSQGEDPLRFMGRQSVLDKELLIMPIHKNLHWQLAIIVGLNRIDKSDSLKDRRQLHWQETSQADTRAPHKASIVLLNSLRSYDEDASSAVLFRRICLSLKAIFTAKQLEPPTSTAFKRIVAEVPQQGNGSDCGIYTVHFCQRVLAEPQKFIAEIDACKSHSWSKPQFWHPDELRIKRKELKEQLCEVHDQIHSAAPSHALQHDSGADDSDSVEILELTSKRRRSKRIEHYL